MKVKRAFKYRCYPTKEQAQNLAHTFGCCRFIYNHALHTRKHAYFTHKKKLSHKDLSVMLTAMKQEQGTIWLRDVSSVPLQQALRHLNAAYTNFFEGRAKYPTFKKKHGEQSATYTDNAFTLKGEQLTFAKQSEPLPIVWSRPLPADARVSSVTVSKDCAGRYFVSLLVEEDIQPLPPVEQQMGIDVGLKSMVVLSTGESVPNPRYYATSEKALARAQRRHARKKKGSKNREKARRKVARLHVRIADQRRDYQHQLSTRIVRENQTICIESLHVKGMVKNHCLAKAISDVGWGEFLRQLEYKARWYGRTFIQIDRWYPSSKRCSACGYILETLPLDVREWTCPACGTHHDRDSNAAHNILAAGLVAAACGEDVRPAVEKSEPAILDEAGRLLR